MDQVELHEIDIPEIGGPEEFLVFLVEQFLVLVDLEVYRLSRAHCTSAF